MQRKQPLPLTWPHEESRGCKFEPKVMGEVLEAVVALNEQLLDALANSARATSAKFPLPDSVRLSFAAMSDGKRRLAARCGVLLLDAGFSDETGWRDLALLGAREAYSNQICAWLSPEESVVLSYSALMVAWYIVHTTPGAAGVLLGMSDPVLEEFRFLGVGNLAAIARRHPHWIQPRWLDRPDVWFDLIDDPARADASHLTTVPLRCLTVSAAYAPNLLASMEAGA